MTNTEKVVKDKAETLFSVMLNLHDFPDRDQAKKAALLVCTEVIKAIHWHREQTPPNWNFWHDVKNEIEKL